MLNDGKKNFFKIIFYFQTFWTVTHFMTHPEYSIPATHLVTHPSLSPQGAADAVLTDPETGEDVEYDYAYYDDAVPESPFVNPYDPSHQKPQLLAGNLAGGSGSELPAWTTVTAGQILLIRMHTLLLKCKCM